MQNNQSQNTELGLSKDNLKSQEKKIIIHTMPKRFVGIRIIAKNHRGIGIFILALGALLMLGALAALYFFVLKPQEKPVVQETFEEYEYTEPAVNLPVENAVKADEKKEVPAAAETQAEEKTEIEADPEENIKEININDIASSTALASSTETAGAAVPYGNTNKILAPDSDQDGLSDIEEMLLDCNPNNIDSDGDGYNDIDELLKLYNPAGAGKLIVNPNIEKYTNNTFKYSLFYPNTWLVTSVDGENSILFQIGNDQYMQIIVQNNLTGNNLDDWYKEQMGVTQIDGNQRMYKAGWSGIKSPDSLIAYLTNPNQNVIYTVSYNTGMDNTIIYSAIFNMIIESLAVVN